MGDGEREHVAGNQDDPRPSPPNGTDRASPRASLHSQAHWGLELELRRPGALAARPLRVVSGSPAAARVLCVKNTKFPNFASHRIARVSSGDLLEGHQNRGRHPSLCFFLGNVDSPTAQHPARIASSSVHRRVYIARRHPFSKSSPPACGSWGQQLLASGLGPPSARCLVSELCIHLHSISCRCLGSSQSGPSATFTLT